jgi:ABC-type branched-subunit amino acid transport system substrate-binding protein
MKRKIYSMTITVGLVLVFTSMLFFISCGSSTTTPTTTASQTATTTSTPTVTPATKILKIGHISCLTGFFSPLDALSAQETDVLAEMINEEGGIVIQGQRYNLQIITEDGKSTLDGVTAAAVKLATQDKVQFVIGPNAYFSSASCPILEENKILHVSEYNTLTPGEMNEDTPYAFVANNGVATRMQIAILAFTKIYPDVKKVAIDIPDDGTPPYIIPLADKLLAEAGLSRAGDPVLFSNDQQDFSPIAAKLNAITDADGFLSPNGIAVHHGNILKQLRQLGNNKVWSDLGGDYSWMTIAGADACNNCFGLIPDLTASDNPPQLTEFIQRLLTTGEELSQMQFSGATCLYALIDVMKKADSIDPDVVKAKWESLDQVDTLFGMSALGGTETYGLKNHVVSSPSPVSTIDNNTITYWGWITPGPLP